MSKCLLVVVGTVVASNPAFGGFVLPIVDLRATTEIHGVPPMGAAHVENKVFFGAPIDGSVFLLFNDDIEVDDPPVANLVRAVVTVTPLGARGQHVEISWFGPNAMDNMPGDDAPILTDLYGTYTDSDNPAGPITGPIDLFDIAATLLWEGFDASALQLDEGSLSATVVSIDGKTTEFGAGDHPLRVDYFLAGQERMRIGLLSSTLFATPWVPELVDTADEVHLAFDIYVPAPATLLLCGAGLLAFGRRRRCP